MTDYLIDYETKSDLDLKKVGQARYLNHKSTDIVFLTWAKRGGEVKLWLPGAPPPFKISPDDNVYAFNVSFDRNAQVILGKRYGLQFIPWEQCIDLMALCARFTLPQNLDGACKVLQLKQQKETAIGRRLMKKICSPPYKYTKQEYLEFVKYGVGDTKAIVEMVERLPADRLSPSEQRCWVRTQKMNERGIEIDVRMAAQITKCVDLYKTKLNQRLAFVTAQEIKTAGQVAKIREWCGNRGWALPDLRAQTVQEYLDNSDLDSLVRQVLEIRQDVASTAVKKFASVQQLALNRILHNILVYHAASTGRFSSRGLQIHNLFRKFVEDPDALIQEFFDGTIFTKNVVLEARKLVRSMIRARPGKTFVISDFGSIEYVVCCWLAGDNFHLEQFAKNICPYKTLAADLLSKLYDDITPEERQMGKPGVLGGIYGLGAVGYIEYAKGYGIKTTREEAETVIYTLRNNYPLVKKLWYSLVDITIAAVQNPGATYTYGYIRAKVIKDHDGSNWLLLYLPSGRPLFYYEPFVGDGKYGPIVMHWGVDSKTRRWTVKELSPNRLVENVTQATARDILTYCEDRLESEPVLEQVFNCHDEIVTECDTEKQDRGLEILHRIMSTPPEWCKSLPLRAETFISKRYTKG